MSVDLEFSRFAKSYERYNIIQKEVAKELVGLIKGYPKRILDIGCGRGEVLKQINWEFDYFVGVDFAKKMLELHPKAGHIECVYGDFENPELYEYLFSYNFDYIVSASALQWAKDLQKVFSLIASLQTPIAFAIFTSHTFETLHKTASITSPLRGSKEVLDIASQYFSYNHYIKKYTLEFEKKEDVFRYIKRSGVSGGKRMLSYKEIKNLMQNYPTKKLEFEVLFLYS